MVVPEVYKNHLFAVRKSKKAVEFLLGFSAEQLYGINKVCHVLKSFAYEFHCTKKVKLPLNLNFWYPLYSVYNAK